MIEKYIAFKMMTEWYIPLALFGMYIVGWILVIIINCLSNKSKKRDKKRADKVFGEEE
jgi:hypothetical protein